MFRLAFGFDRLIDREVVGCFYGVIGFADGPLNPKDPTRRLVHYWLEIKSVCGGDTVYIDDNVGSGEFVHPKQPAPPGYEPRERKQGEVFVMPKRCVPAIASPWFPEGVKPPTPLPPLNDAMFELDDAFDAPDLLDENHAP